MIGTASTPEQGVEQKGVEARFDRQHGNRGITLVGPDEPSLPRTAAKETPLSLGSQHLESWPGAMLSKMFVASVPDDIDVR